MIQTFTSLFNLLFPRTCAACGETLQESEQCLCLSCLADLPKTNFHRVEDNPVSRIFWGRVNIFRATSLFFFSKGSKFQEMMHHFKYSGVREVGFEMGKILGSDLKEARENWDVDVIIPVPLHPEKEKKRGYNQSEWIAKGISEILEARVAKDAITRSIASSTQTRKNRFERWNNVKDIFSLSTEAKTLAGKHILLVDDVLTTGATLEACAHELEKIEGVRISIATLAAA
jgi:ComF family protein